MQWEKYEVLLGLEGGDMAPSRRNQEGLHEDGVDKMVLKDEGTCQSSLSPNEE